MQQAACVYIITNQHHTTLYVGYTSNLRRRAMQHKGKYFPRSFTARYNINKLVYFEAFPTTIEAIEREKQLKAGSRKRKIDLINSKNPEWKDLFEEIKNW
jgi:putative endonuclease